eukprot:scaffold56129_cov69-Phaeocystis_antarctica.AAC.4
MCQHLIDRLALRAKVLAYVTLHGGAPAFLLRRVVLVVLDVLRYLFRKRLDLLYERHLLVQCHVVPRSAIVQVVSPTRVAATLARVALAGMVIAVAHLHPVAPLHGAPLVLPGVQWPASHERLRFLERQEPPAHLGSVDFGGGVGERRARLAVLVAAAAASRDDVHLTQRRRWRRRRRLRCLRRRRDLGNPQKSALLLRHRPRSPDRLEIDR